MANHTDTHAQRVMATIKAIIPEARHMQMGQNEKPFRSYIIRPVGGMGWCGGVAFLREF